MAIILDYKFENLKKNVLEVQKQSQRKFETQEKIPEKCVNNINF